MAREALIIDEDVATGGGFTPLPKAWYTVEIDEVDEVESKSAKNTGKPMYKYKFKIIEGEFADRKLFTQACLWQEAIFTQRDIQKALNIPLGKTENGKVAFLIADPEDLIGKELKVYVVIKDKYVPEGEEPETNPDGTPVQENEVKRFAPVGGASAPAAGGRKKAGAAKAGEFAL